jgi:hypothetical protein
VSSGILAARSCQGNLSTHGGGEGSLLRWRPHVAMAGGVRVDVYMRPASWRSRSGDGGGTNLGVDGDLVSYGFGEA